MRQRVDLLRSLDVLQAPQAREGIGSVDGHRARAADTLAARAAEGERRVDLILDLDESVENHRPAALVILSRAVYVSVLVALGVPAVDAKLLPRFLVLRLVPGLAALDLGVPRKRELNHGACTFLLSPSGRRRSPT